MTWPFENNTNGIVKNLAKEKSKKRKTKKCYGNSIGSFYLLF